MHVGLIGGIGAAATVLYYQRLTAEMARRRHRLELTIVQADVHDLIENIENNQRAKQAQIYAALIDRLRAAGAECAAITSLGGHFCFAETETLSTLPLVSAVRPIDAYCTDLGLNRIGLLGTELVMRTKLYGQLNSVESVVLEPEIGFLGRTYQEMAVAGVCSTKQREVFVSAGRRLVEDHGAEAVVLAGTDLNLAFDEAAVDYQLVDPVDAHVQALVRLATDEVGIREFEVA